MNIAYWLKRAGRYWKPPMLVLMYHRIAEAVTDPWSLAVSPAHFEQQLHFLKKKGLVMPMHSLVGQLYSKKRPGPGIVITFDDGYLDNFLMAKPLLEKYAIPATFFISNQHIGSRKEFWWDALAYIFLEAEHLPEKIYLSIKGQSYSFDLSGEERLTGGLLEHHKGWNYTQPFFTQRSRIYYKIWELLSPLNYDEQQMVLSGLKQQIGMPDESRENYCSMSEDQLLEMADHPLFTIGGHTISHPALASHNMEVQENEIVGNKKYLESLTSKKIETFAYPSGNYNEQTIEILKKQGFKAAFTTGHHIVSQENDLFQTGRFQVNDWNEREFRKMLSHFSSC